MGWCSAQHLQTQTKIDNTPTKCTLCFPVPSACWRKTMAHMQLMAEPGISLVVGVQSISIGRHSWMWTRLGGSIHHIYGPLNGINFLNTLALELFLWLLLPRRGLLLMYRSWINLAWYKSSTRCQVNNHGRYPWGGQGRQGASSYNLTIQHPWHNVVWNL